MNQLPSNIRKDLLKIVPHSIVNEIVCFAFYDNHPRDTKAIDVIVCTQRGEIKEFYKRDVGLSYLLQNIKNIKEIKVLRNSKCDLFYLVLADDKVIMLSRKEHNISILHEIINVSSYSIEDKECNGQASVKIIKNDDAVPLVFDENFETIQEIDLTSKESNKSDDMLPLLVQLQRKVSEAQYCVKFNEGKYKQLLDLKQQAIFHIYQTRGPSDLHSSSKVNLKEISNLLQIETRHPEVRLCNKKILIILNVANRNHEPLEDVTVLLNSSAKHSITYTTRLYTEIAESPYWREKDSRIIEPNTTVSVVAVVNLKELQQYACSRIQFEVVLSYCKEGKLLLLPFEQVWITAGDIMGEDFDILSRKRDDDRKMTLCLLSSCDKNILHLKHIISKPMETVTPYEIFCTHLKMELCADNVAIHNMSPYHILHGVMVVFISVHCHNINIEVYTRSPSQVLALIHYIYDAVPHRIIAMTPDITIISPEDTTKENETCEDAKDLNFEELGKALIKQTSLLKEYLDDCLIKMNESKNPIVRARVGREIDVVAQGLPKFMEIRKKILDTTEEGISKLKKNVIRNESLDMVVSE